MPNEYDAVIIGAGHNGLVTAGYLARAGLRTLVLESRHVVGGACVTEEIFPGYKFSTTSYLCSLMQEKVTRDLELEKFGFTVYPKDPAFFSPFPDGRYLIMGSDTAADLQGDRQILRARRGALPALRGVCRPPGALRRTAAARDPAGHHAGADSATGKSSPAWAAG